jgi:hypothetical protein
VRVSSSPSAREIGDLDGIEACIAAVRNNPTHHQLALAFVKVVAKMLQLGECDSHPFLALQMHPVSSYPCTSTGCLRRGSPQQLQNFKFRLQ